MASRLRKFSVEALAWLIAAGVVVVFFEVALPASYQPGVVIDCLDEAELARTKELTIRAIDDAYADQIGRLFRSWMGDSHGQPGRAQAGVSQAITAWRTARRGADGFMPPQCTVTRAK